MSAFLALVWILSLSQGAILRGGDYLQVPDEDNSENSTAKSPAAQTGAIGGMQQRRISQELAESPKPFSFDYRTDGEDGSSSMRRETGNGKGRVTGFYSLADPDGRKRLVQYVADENGFRAIVRTNEFGTESKSPADVDIKSTAPTAAELVSKYSWVSKQLRRTPQNSKKQQFVIIPVE